MTARAHRASHGLLVTLLVAMALTTTAASSGLPNDIHDAAEHLAEAAQDARYFSLPWPGLENPAGSWKSLAGLGYAKLENEFGTASGTLWTVGAEHGPNAKWQLILAAYFDRFTLGGDSSEGRLTAKGLVGVPLELPATAAFSDPGGTIQHFGGVALFSRRSRSKGSSSLSRDWIAGAMIERLSLSDYKVHYRLLDGANAGAEGTLDHSATPNFVTPFVGVQWIRPFRGRIVASLHVALGNPFPAGDLPVRLTGPDFDLTTSSTGATPQKIGDGFLVAGLVIRDRKTGLGIDLGSLLSFPVLEEQNHPGVQRSMLLSISWHQP